MNSKHRAELQRKLTLNAVPRPPAGLAERIKADIPKYLEPESAPARFTRALPFNLRIAASIMLLTTSVVVAMMMVNRPEQRLASVETARPVIFPPASRAIATTDTASTMTVARTEEVHLDITEEVPEIPQIAAGRVAPPAMVPAPVAQPQLGEMDDTRAQRDAETGAEGGRAFGIVGGTATGVVGNESRESAAPADEPQFARAEPLRQDADFTEPAPPEPAKREARPAFAVAPASKPAPAEEKIAVTSEAPAMGARRERAAASPGSIVDGLDYTQAKKKDSVFGISTDAKVFNDIRATLENGQRPAASAVNVEALVNYFAGPPARRPRKVELDVEASPAALPAEGEHAVLRFSIDTPAGNGMALTDARVDVVINSAVVATARRVGGGNTLARESSLPSGTSVTGLYALEMKPGLRATQLVATVRLHYVANGKPDLLTANVYGHDLAKSWKNATRRHRLASLGALWGESLKSRSGGGVDVARRAEELATQEPDDVRARELARAASASAAGGR